MISAAGSYRVRRRRRGAGRDGHPGAARVRGHRTKRAAGQHTAAAHHHRARAAAAHLGRQPRDPGHGVLERRARWPSRPRPWPTPPGRSRTPTLAPDQAAGPEPARCDTAPRRRRLGQLHRRPRRADHVLLPCPALRPLAGDQVLLQDRHAEHGAGEDHRRRADPERHYRLQPLLHRDLKPDAKDNSLVPNYGSGQPNLQTSWLEKTLAEARHDRSVDMIVVFMHQCAMTSIPARVPAKPPSPSSTSRSPRSATRQARRTTAPPRCRRRRRRSSSSAGRWAAGSILRPSQPLG